MKKYKAPAIKIIELKQDDILMASSLAASIGFSQGKDAIEANVLDLNA